MLDKEKVWISDPHDGFILGRIVDLTDEGALVEHLEGKRMESTVSFEQVNVSLYRGKAVINSPRLGGARSFSELLLNLHSTVSVRLSYLKQNLLSRFSILSFYDKIFVSLNRY